MRHFNLQGKSHDGPTYHEAFLYKEELINTWSPASDMLPFKFGDDALGIVAGMGSLAVSFMFRKALKIRPYARLTCYFPVLGVASISSYMINSIIISTDIVQAKKCPLCIWTKANVGQLLCSTVYPFIAAPIVCFYVADKLMTYPVPPLVRAPRELFSLFYKIMSRNPKLYLIIGSMNIIACSTITYLKQNAYQKILEKDKILYGTLPKQ